VTWKAKQNGLGTNCPEEPVSAASLRWLRRLISELLSGLDHKESPGNYGYQRAGVCIREQQAELRKAGGLIRQDTLALGDGGGCTNIVQYRVTLLAF
jgi:hypothetical protein